MLKKRRTEAVNLFQKNASGDGIRAVSYTHLDVYKRQDTHNNGHSNRRLDDNSKTTDDKSVFKICIDDQTTLWI